MASDTVKLKDGTQLRLRMAGSGPVLLMLHGWAVSGELFDAQLDTLAATHTVICPDLRAHGASQIGSQRPLSIALLAEDVAELIATLSLKDVCLIGWSMGAMVAWQTVSQYPALPVTSLVTVDMTPKLGNADDWQLGLIRDSEGTAGSLRKDWQATVARFVPRIFASGTNEANTQDIARITALAENNPADPLAELWHSMVAQDFRAVLSQIRVPCLIMHGAKSQLYPAETTQFVAAQLPHSELVTFDHSGHAPHIEEPALFNRILTDFSFRVSGKETSNNVAHA